MQFPLPKPPRARKKSIAQDAEEQEIRAEVERQAAQDRYANLLRKDNARQLEKLVSPTKKRFQRGAHTVRRASNAINAFRDAARLFSGSISPSGVRKQGGKTSSSTAVRAFGGRGASSASEDEAELNTLRGKFGGSSPSRQGRDENGGSPSRTTGGRFFREMVRLGVPASPGRPSKTRGLGALWRARQAVIDLAAGGEEGGTGEGGAPAKGQKHIDLAAMAFGRKRSLSTGALMETQQQQPASQGKKLRSRSNSVDDTSNIMTGGGMSMMMLERRLGDDESEDDDDSYNVNGVPTRDRVTNTRGPPARRGVPPAPVLPKQALAYYHDDTVGGDEEEVDLDARAELRERLWKEQKQEEDEREYQQELERQERRRTKSQKIPNHTLKNMPRNLKDMIPTWEVAQPRGGDLLLMRTLGKIGVADAKRKLGDYKNALMRYNAWKSPQCAPDPIPKIHPRGNQKAISEVHGSGVVTLEAAWTEGLKKKQEEIKDIKRRGGDMYSESGWSVSSPVQDAEAHLNPLTRVQDPELLKLERQQMREEQQEREQQAEREDRFLAEFRGGAGGAAGSLNSTTTGAGTSAAGGGVGDSSTMAAPPSQKFSIFDKLGKKVHFSDGWLPDEEDDGDLEMRGMKMKAKSSQTRVMTRLELLEKEHALQSGKEQLALQNVSSPYVDDSPSKKGLNPSRKSAGGGDAYAKPLDDEYLDADGNPLPLEWRKNERAPITMARTNNQKVDVVKEEKDGGNATDWRKLPPVFRRNVIGLYFFAGGVALCIVPYNEAGEKYAGKTPFDWTDARCRLWRFGDRCSVCSTDDSCGAGGAKFTNGCLFDVLIRYNNPETDQEEEKVATGVYNPDYRWSNEKQEYRLKQDPFSSCPAGRATSSGLRLPRDEMLALNDNCCGYHRQSDNLFCDVWGQGSTKATWPCRVDHKTVDTAHRIEGTPPPAEHWMFGHGMQEFFTYAGLCFASAFLLWRVYVWPYWFYQAYSKRQRKVEAELRRRELQEKRRLELVAKAVPDKKVFVTREEGRMAEFNKPDFFSSAALYYDEPDGAEIHEFDPNVISSGSDDADADVNVFTGSSGEDGMDANEQGASSFSIMSDRAKPKLKIAPGEDRGLSPSGRVVRSLLSPLKKMRPRSRSLQDKRTTFAYDESRDRYRDASKLNQLIDLPLHGDAPPTTAAFAGTAAPERIQEHGGPVTIEHAAGTRGFRILRSLVGTSRGSKSRHKPPRETVSGQMHNRDRLWDNLNFGGAPDGDAAVGTQDASYASRAVQLAGIAPPSLTKGNEQVGGSSSSTQGTSSKQKGSFTAAAMRRAMGMVSGGFNQHPGLEEAAEEQRSTMINMQDSRELVGARPGSRGRARKNAAATTRDAVGGIGHHADERPTMNPAFDVRTGSKTSSAGGSGMGYNDLESTYARLKVPRRIDSKDTNAGGGAEQYGGASEGSNYKGTNHEMVRNHLAPDARGKPIPSYANPGPGPDYFDRPENDGAEDSVLREMFPFAADRAAGGIGTSGKRPASAGHFRGAEAQLDPSRGIPAHLQPDVIDALPRSPIKMKESIEWSRQQESRLLLGGPVGAGEQSADIVFRGEDGDIIGDDDGQTNAGATASSAWAVNGTGVLHHQSEDFSASSSFAGDDLLGSMNNPGSQLHGTTSNADYMLEGGGAMKKKAGFLIGEDRLRKMLKKASKITGGAGRSRTGESLERTSGTDYRNRSSSSKNAKNMRQPALSDGVIASRTTQQEATRPPPFFRDDGSDKKAASGASPRRTRNYSQNTGKNKLQPVPEQDESDAGVSTRRQLVKDDDVTAEDERAHEERRLRMLSERLVVPKAKAGTKRAKQIATSAVSTKKLTAHYQRIGNMRGGEGVAKTGTGELAEYDNSHTNPKPVWEVEHAKLMAAINAKSPAEKLK
ncbi:unnamed protein product [Amoebophrya sp. A25]|nr:unnamed protein product [Amoebophrya sp. A25]|eukprot:GSA25T00024071001.1